MSADEGTALADQMRADIRLAGRVSAKALTFAE